MVYNQKNSICEKKLANIVGSKYHKDKNDKAAKRILRKIINIFTMKIKLIPILLAGALFVSSCSKTETMNPTEQVFSKDKTENKILAFAETLKAVKSGEKSGDATMTVEEAKWNIEAALNYFNVTEDTDEEVEFESRKVTIDINPVDDELTMDEITAIAAQMNASINMDPSQKLAVADVYIVTKVDGSLAIEMTSKLVKPTSEDKTFDDDDYWSFYNGGGYCDGPNEGSLTSFGAPEKLDYHVNHYAFGGWKQRYLNTFYTDIEVSNPISALSDIIPNLQDDIQGDFYLDHMLYVDEDDPTTGYMADQCLDPIEMNYYAIDGIPNVITEFKPTNKEFVSVTTYGLLVGNPTRYFHAIKVTYGIKHEQLSALTGWTP